MLNDWLNGADASLTWSDNDKAIQVFVTDECKRDAKLSAEDCYFDGESEVPIWYVRFANGQRTELVAIPRWRFA